jgi:hypothetical protein
VEAHHAEQTQAAAPNLSPAYAQGPHDRAGTLGELRCYDAICGVGEVILEPGQLRKEPTDFQAMRQHPKGSQVRAAGTFVTEMMTLEVHVTYCASIEV